ncbi:MAG: HAMP domain-containing sensor histidine kinase [Candidatus Zixiibacteriota bacterium]
MKTRRDLRPARFALFVFVGLIIFCVAQLSWWIIYQIDLSKQLSKHQAELLDQKIEIVSLTANRCFQQRVNMISYAINMAENRERYLDSLLSDSIITGYSIGANPEEWKHSGLIDSTFYANIGSGITVFFDSQFPGRLLEDSKGEIQYKPYGHISGKNLVWVVSDMFEIRPEVKEELERSTHGRIMMFASEGSFFVLITLFGAFLIYRTLQRSEELTFRQQNFIHAVTHEFRTPLTSLRLYLQTLQSGKLNDEKKQDLYGKMLDDCYRLEGMVDNVLEAGRSGRQDYRLNLEKTNLTDDLAEYLDNLKPVVDGLGGKIERHLAPDIIVKADYQALERALRAIVENALKYSKPESRNITVTLSRQGLSACVSIADKGPGIPAHEQKNIFDRFYRIGDESTRSVKGTGLGLYLVKQTVEAHGGTVEVKSEGAARGSVFTIRLPLVQ